MRKEVKWFARLMEKKLKKNDFKSSWKYENTMYLYERLLEEIEEFKNAEGYKNQIDECIDIANFTMMLAHQLRKENV